MEKRKGYEYFRKALYTQSCCTYQKFRAPARLVLTLHVYRARALAHLFQPSQGCLNELRPSAARSNHTSQTNRALGVKHARARLKLPSVSTTLILPHPTHTHTSLYPTAPTLAHQVLSRAALCSVRSRDCAGLYSEGACYVMIEALDSEHNLFFYNKL